MKCYGYAKVNLSLEILGKREDGYHLLSTVMHTIDLANEIDIEPASEIIIEADIPLPYNSVVRRAVEGYRRIAAEKNIIISGANIKIKSNIPSEAGLGSSSADAGAVLLALNKQHHALTTDELKMLAATIGADVPFALTGGCALCEGIGERITTLNPLSLPLLIVKGKHGVSTAQLFARLGYATPTPEKPRSAHSEDLLLAINAGMRTNAIKSVFNDLTSAAVNLAPEIAIYTDRLKQSGAISVCMTGSGAAVYGIFSSMEAAKLAKNSFSDAAFAACCYTV